MRVGGRHDQFFLEGHELEDGSFEFVRSGRRIARGIGIGLVFLPLTLLTTDFMLHEATSALVVLTFVQALLFYGFVFVAFVIMTVGLLWLMWVLVRTYRVHKHAERRLIRGADRKNWRLEESRPGRRDCFESDDAEVALRVRPAIEPEQKGAWYGYVAVVETPDRYFVLGRSEEFDRLRDFSDRLSIRLGVTVEESDEPLDRRAEHWLCHLQEGSWAVNNDYPGDREIMFHESAGDSWLRRIRMVFIFIALLQLGVFIAFVSRVSIHRMDPEGAEAFVQRAVLTYDTLMDARRRQFNPNPKVMFDRATRSDRVDDAWGYCAICDEPLLIHPLESGWREESFQKVVIYCRTPHPDIALTLLETDTRKTLRLSRWPKYVGIGREGVHYFVMDEEPPWAWRALQRDK